MGSTSLFDLLNSLVSLPTETEWVIYEEDGADPATIGKSIAALANTAAFLGRDCGYMVWGVESASRNLVGTSFNPSLAKGVGRQLLPKWLATKLSSNALYCFETATRNGLSFVVLTVEAAYDQPVYFNDVAFIREGGSTIQLRPASGKERELWVRLQNADYLEHAVCKDLTDSEAFALLDVEAFFDLLGMPYPSSSSIVLDVFADQGLVRKQDKGLFTVTNFALLLIGKKLSSFFGMRKRALRVVRFSGTGNTEVVNDTTFDEGYALALPKAEEFIMQTLSACDMSGDGIQQVDCASFKAAVHELLLNMVIHQDFSQSSSGPLVSIYSNRIGFSNPGATLVASDRILNAVPNTRNPELANMLCQMDYCNDAGIGWDKAVQACETLHLPAPKVLSDNTLGTNVTLSIGRTYKHMSKQERLDALYWHSCLMYSSGSCMNNLSLRNRFGLSCEKKDIVAISRLIKEACDLGIVKEEDALAGNKAKRYLPSWA